MEANRLRIPSFLKWISIFVLFVLLVNSCTEKCGCDEFFYYDYDGTYSNNTYSEKLIKEYLPGIYPESDIPDEIKQLQYGRIEINFRYNGGGAASFMPLFYYGSVNRNATDNAFEEPQFHMAIEIGHYNVIPTPVDNFFYTICTDRYPRYCRDSFSPVSTDKDYTFVMDKTPNGILIQLKKGNVVVNSFPHAYFPDSTQMFFRDVTRYTDKNKGDSLETTLMVGKGYAGIEPGIHQFNGNIESVKIYGYSNISSNSSYVIERLRNQHCEDERIKCKLLDKSNGNNTQVQMTYDFWPYRLENGELLPNGAKQVVIWPKQPNNSEKFWNLEKKDIGYYQLHLQTFNSQGQVINSTSKPFELWVYPKEWEFNY